MTTEALTVVHPGTGQQLIWTELRGDAVVELNVAAPRAGMDSTDERPAAKVFASFWPEHPVTGDAGVVASVDGNVQASVSATWNDDGLPAGWLHAEEPVTA